MADGEAELMISPELSEKDLREAMQKMETAFSKTGNEIEKSLKKKIHDGAVEGAETGAKKSKNVFRRMFTSMKSMGQDWTKQTFGSNGREFVSKGLAGAKILAGSTFGFLLAGVMDSIARSDESRGLIASLLGEGGLIAQRSQAAARAGGMTNAQFAQQSVFFQRTGGLERGEYAEQVNAVARTLGENQTNAQFAAYKGLGAGDAIAQALATYTTGKYKNDPSSGLAALGLLGIDENTASRMLQATSTLGGNTADERLKELREANKSQAKQYAEVLSQELNKGAEYRRQMFDTMLSNQAESLNNINKGSFDAIKEYDKQQNTHNQNVLKDIEMNTKNAIAARDTIETLQTKANELSSQVVTGINKIAMMMEQSVLFKKAGNDGKAINVPDPAAAVPDVMRSVTGQATSRAQQMQMLGSSPWLQNALGGKQ